MEEQNTTQTPPVDPGPATQQPPTQPEPAAPPIAPTPAQAPAPATGAGLTANQVANQGQMVDQVNEIKEEKPIAPTPAHP